jgi:GMP synthase-like glutamine amidotransferase
MILYIVTDTYEKYLSDPGWFWTRNTLERIAGDACVVLHYKQVNLEMVEHLRPWAICHSGGSTDYANYDVLEELAYRQLVWEAKAAQIGFCGGHQILACFFGSQIGPMRRLRSDEPDPAPYSPGFYKEWGIYPIQIIKEDPLFANCGEIVRVQEYHYWEVKQLGQDLELLASSQECRVQAFRHRAKPIYGTQFHPEQSREPYLDGEIILRNFFLVAKSVETQRVKLDVLSEMFSE